MKTFNQKLLLLILIFQLFANLTKAQIDTTILYPLQIGNYWEYSNRSGSEYFTKEVISDTVIENKKYAVIKATNTSLLQYIRVEDNFRVYKLHLSDIPWEEKLCDFNEDINTLWLAWPSDNVYSRVVIKDEHFNDIIKTSSLRQGIEYYWIDTLVTPPDTNWMGLHIQYQKGVGQILSGSELGGVYELRGAIINGVRYGYITSVEESGEEIINDYHLEQNYPNPFNPTTQITYQIPRAGFVKLVVYNGLGQLVSTLVNERKERGRYTVEFNAENLPSGMYIYRITAGKYRASGKMLLMK